MPYKTQYVAPKLFMEHNGVKVYHTYKNDDIDDRVYRYDYTLSADNCENNFDIRDLEVSETELLKNKPKFMSLDDSAELRKVLQTAWDNWNNIEEPKAIKCIIKSAIDKGLIK